MPDLKPTPTITDDIAALRVRGHSLENACRNLSNALNNVYETLRARGITPLTRSEGTAA
jgi:hypothetical protein